MATGRKEENRGTGRLAGSRKMVGWDYQNVVGGS
jgi:hypothetical protein